MDGINVIDRINMLIENCKESNEEYYNHGDKMHVIISDNGKHLTLRLGDYNNDFSFHIHGDNLRAVKSSSFDDRIYIEDAKSLDSIWMAISEAEKLF